MPTQKKIFTVQNLTQKLKDAKSLVLADYRGLSVAQIVELRQKAKAVGGELEVAKNRLLKIAAKEAKISLDDQALSGPTIVLWAWEDEIAPIKALAKFSDEHGLPQPKSGLFEGEVISAEKINQLAKIPAREELQAQLVGNLNSPIFGLVNALNWNLRKLTFILKAKVESSNPPA